MTENLPARTEAPRPAVKVDINKPLTDLDEAMRLSQVLSTSELIPRALFGKPASILHVLLTGQNLGLHWTESVRVIYSPGQGQIGMRGAFLLAQLRKAGHTYSATYNQDGSACTFTLHRGDTKEQFEATFSVEDAVTAGLAKRKDDGTIVALSRDGKPLPWQAWAKRMLRWRAVSECVGFGAPEVMLGFEIEGAVDAEQPRPEVTLSPQPPAAASPREPARVDEHKPAAGVTLAGEDPEPPATDTDRATEEQLRELDARMRSDQDEVIRAAGVDPVTLLPVAEPEEAAEAAEEQPAEPPAGSRDRAKDQVLAERFEALGWHPRRYKANVLHACSVFLRRRVSGVRDMSTAEIMSLAAELSSIQRRHDPEAHPVALADAVEAWREAWLKEDPDGLGEYEAANNG